MSFPSGLFTLAGKMPIKIFFGSVLDVLHSPFNNAFHVLFLEQIQKHRKSKRHYLREGINATVIQGSN
jgi:hypothetical protein